MFDPRMFDQESVDDAKAVILTAGGGLTTAERWDLETAWLMRRIAFDDDGLVIDYGCGIGRLAREIKNPVLGVDISAPMRRHAIEYVGKSIFCAISPEMFETMVDSGLRACGVVAAWSLQHVLDLRRTVDVLARSLRPGGLFWLLDLGDRHVPGAGGVMPDDGERVGALIARTCKMEGEERLDVWRDDPGNAGTLRRYRRV